MTFLSGKVSYKLQALNTACGQVSMEKRIFKKWNFYNFF